MGVPRLMNREDPFSWFHFFFFFSLLYTAVLSWKLGVRAAGFRERVDLVVVTFFCLFTCCCRFCCWFESLLRELVSGRVAIDSGTEINSDFMFSQRLAFDVDFAKLY
jgi:hypothetical protein